MHGQQARGAAKINQAIKSARSPWGDGWNQLTPAIRRALVHSAILGQFAAVDREDLSMERRAELFGRWQQIADEVLGAEDF
jgi:hypothetical protein